MVLNQAGAEGIPGGVSRRRMLEAEIKAAVHDSDIE
jgi:hypothetical protein